MILCPSDFPEWRSGQEEIHKIMIHKIMGKL